MRKQKINRVVSKWFEALQGSATRNLNLKEGGLEMDTASTPNPCPRLLLTCSDITQSKGYTLEWGIFPLYGNLASQTKHWDTWSEEQGWHSF